MPTTSQNQQQGSTSPDNNSRDFLSRDRLFQDDSSQQHGPQRHTGGNNGRFSRRAQVDSKNKTTLIKNDRQQRCPKQFENIFQWYMLLSLKKRSKPEQHHRTPDTQSRNIERCYRPARHDIFRHGRHQSPHNISSQHGSMPFPTDSFHFLYPLQELIDFFGRKINTEFHFLYVRIILKATPLKVNFSALQTHQFIPIETDKTQKVVFLSQK